MRAARCDVLLQGPTVSERRCNFFRGKGPARTISNV